MKYCISQLSLRWSAGWGLHRHRVMSSPWRALVIVETAHSLLFKPSSLVEDLVQITQFKHAQLSEHFARQGTFRELPYDRLSHDYDSPRRKLPSIRPASVISCQLVRIPLKLSKRMMPRAILSRLTLEPITLMAKEVDDRSSWRTSPIN